jgi:pSer/pThr/pTyr-binding forkhead associated (FHA) protein
MGSANSVFINGQRTPEPYRLNHGDQVLLGDTVLRFVVR